MGNRILSNIFYKIFQRSIEGRIRNSFSKEGYKKIAYSEDVDIFIAGYPKSGNTWFQNLLTCMLLESTSENITPKLVSELIPDVHARTHYKRILPRMFFKTHDLPKPHHKKVIHLIRDGRDAYVSYYHYLNLNKKKKMTLKELTDQEDTLFPSSWKTHTEAWMENPYKAEILTVRYEDLKSDHRTELIKIMEFAGISVRHELLDEIYAKNTVDALRNKVSKHGWDYFKSYGQNSPKFFRKGVVGDYKKEMSDELVSEFNKKNFEALKAFKYI